MEQLNPTWKASFDVRVNGSDDKSMLNSLVDLRNTFAHRTAITPSIDDVIRSFECGCNVLRILDEIVGENE